MEHIERVLRKALGNISKAASILGISRFTLYRKIREIHEFAAGRKADETGLLSNAEFNRNLWANESGKRS